MPDEGRVNRHKVESWVMRWKDEIHGDRHLEAAGWQNGEGVSVSTGDSGSRIDLCFEDIPHLRRLLRAILKDIGYRKDG